MGFADVEEYMSSLTPTQRAVLEQVRDTLLAAIPDGQDAIAYQMPTVKVGGTSVVHYSAWKHHVSLYPVPEGDAALRRDLESFVAGKGTLHLPLDQPVPTDLLSRVAAALLREHT